jgi:hypothetical protein
MGKKVKVIVDVTELGRKGGLARAESLTPAERTAGASHAAAARWEKYYKEHPERLKAKLEREAKAGRNGRKRATRG